MKNKPKSVNNNNDFIFYLLLPEFSEDTMYKDFLKNKLMNK